MTWSIQLPHRGDRSAPLSTVAEAARHLQQDEDREVTRQLVMDWRLGGLRTVGEALDLVEALDPPARRALLDGARKACGLEPTAEVDARRPAALTIRRTGPSGAFPSCAAEGCNAAPVRFGAFYTPDVRRWWCDAHIDQAQPGDLEPRGSGLKLSPSGVPIPDDLAADAAERDREASDRARRQVTAEVRAVEAAEARASKEAADAAHQAELPPHLRETVA